MADSADDEKEIKKKKRSFQNHKIFSQKNVFFFFLSIWKYSRGDKNLTTCFSCQGSVSIDTVIEGYRAVMNRNSIRYYIYLFPNIQELWHMTEGEKWEGLVFLSCPI